MVTNLQVKELSSQGLKRELEIVIPVTELLDKLQTRLDELGKQANIKGFRKGKVPLVHIKRLYGKAAMSEIIENTAKEASDQAIQERDEKYATVPRFNFPEDESEAMQVIEGKKDLQFTLSYEILPDITVTDVSKISIERLSVETGEKELEESLQTLAEQARPYNEKDGAAEKHDQITFSYKGFIDGKAFEGGADENATLTLGSGQFIPGFEDQLTGLKKHETKTIRVTFPEDYQAKHLAGKAADFEVEVKQVAAPGDIEINDALAKKLGMEDLEKLREALRKNIEQSYSGRARQHVKRQLLDALDQAHSFDVPEALVNQEFEQIWAQVEQELKQSGSSFEDKGKTEEQERANYRKICERRVRLGLLISKIGQEQKITVSQQETEQALRSTAANYPGQEAQVLEYYSKNPNMIGNVTAPIFEDKVVDYLLELIQITEKTLSREEFEALMKKEEEDEEDL